MTRFVVDASVAIKWFVPEIHSDAAERLLTDKLELWVPDFIWAEFGNILLKKWRQGEISLEKARFILGAFRYFSLKAYSSEALADAAWEIASQFQRSFYDSLYLALAVQQGYRMVTADRRLYNALQSSRVAHHLLWVEDVP
ncbi:MAG TPA: type II toxin-antitoxin system VapC family toxin [Thermoanaerobaculia bacterium]|nr:type II toxin-antitoxin system VapC family toxin [Thermoanaerobaculia bacterium]